MPDLIRLFVQSLATGFALALVFVGLLLAFDVAGLRGLILASEVGVLALVMLVTGNGLVFAPVQVALALAGPGPQG